MIKPDQVKGSIVSLKSTGQYKQYYILLWVSFILTLLGITLPALKIKKLFLFNDNKSLVGAAIELLMSNEIFMGLVVVTFTIVFPFVKIFLLFKIYRSQVNAQTKALLGKLEFIGKWSMADVLVVSLVVVSIKVSGLANASTLPGIYFFACGIFLSMFVSSKFARIIKVGDV